jgi:hypothetical protein
MPLIETLLRDALDSVPAPRTADPRQQIARRVRRVRTQRRVGVVLGVAAIAAAVIAPVTLLGGSSGQPHAVFATTPPHSATWKLTDLSPEGVTYAADSVWVSGSGTSSTPRWYVDRLDPATGDRLMHIDVPGPINFVSTGLGYVWAYGGGDGAYPKSSIVLLDPSTGHFVAAKTIAADQGGPSSVAFARDSAWFVLSDSREIARARLTDAGNLKVTTVALPQGQDNPSIAATGDGTVWVGPVNGQVVKVVPQGRFGLRLSMSSGWPGRMLATGGTHSIWTTEAASPKSRVSLLSPALLKGCVSCAYSPRLFQGFAAYSVEQTGRDLWIGGHNHVAFYADAKRSPDGPPTTKLAISGADGSPVDVLSMSATSRTLYFVTDQEDGVHVWTPSTASPGTAG